MMVSRRNLPIGAASLRLAMRARADEPILTDDGLYKQSWFLESFLDLADDLEGARKEESAFCRHVGAQGLLYCKETHLVNFAQPRISDYVKSNFSAAARIIGSQGHRFRRSRAFRKALAANTAYDSRQPSSSAEDAAALKVLPPAKREVARSPGYLRPDDFLAMFRYVRESV